MKIIQKFFSSNSVNVISRKTTYNHILNFEEEDGPLILVNDDLAKQFKKVIFSEITIGINNGGQNREKEPSAELLAAFKKLLDVCGQKIRGVEFTSKW